MSNFSNGSSGSNKKAQFKKHHVYEVATSLADSKHIATDYSNAHKYQHRARVTLVGHSTLRPFDPIYLDGLPNGMSGYWTVLSIKHIFGGRPANYMLDVEVGTDVIGDVNEFAYLASDTRNIQSELSNQSLTAADSSILNTPVSVNQSDMIENVGITSPTPVVSISDLAVPEGITSTPFDTTPPDFTGVKRTVQWTSQRSGRVIT